MSVTAIFPDPPVGQVGGPTTLQFEGTPAGNDLRWFLRERPLGSALALDVRLSEPSFTPDAPGRYVVALKDVTVTTPGPRWDGDPTVAAPTDDEATAPETQRVYWVAETLSRKINAGRGSATLSLSSYDDRADETRPGVVALKADQGTALEVEALADPYLVAALAELRGELELSAYLGPSVALLDALWRGLFLHTVLLTPSGAHSDADPSPTSSGPLSTLPACQSRLVALAGELAAHHALGPPQHITDAAPLALTVPLGSTLGEACAYAAALDRAIAYHGSLGGLLDPPRHGAALADPAEGLWREPPYDFETLAAFCGSLSARLAAHKASANGPLDLHKTVTHRYGDSPFSVGMSQAAAIAGIGQMIDAFAAHVGSHVGDPTPGAHSAKRQPPPIAKTGDPAGAAKAVEALALAFQEHAFDLAAHHGRPGMGAAMARVGPAPDGGRWPHTLRLSARLASVVGSATPPTPANRNRAAHLFKTSWGWTK